MTIVCIPPARRRSSRVPGQGVGHLVRNKFFPVFPRDDYLGSIPIPEPLLGAQTEFYGEQTFETNERIRKIHPRQQQSVSNSGSFRRLNVSHLCASGSKRIRMWRRARGQGCRNQDICISKASDPQTPPPSRGIVMGKEKQPLKRRRRRRRSPSRTGQSSFKLLRLRLRRRRRR